MAKIKELYKKYKEIILYFVFGGLTTVVNFVVTYIMQKGFHLSGEGLEFILSNGVAWICSVTFAYITSHLFVFESKAKGTKAICIEAGKFYGSRIFTGIIETTMPSGLVQLGLKGDLSIGKSFVFEGFWPKAITGVVVIILNYILSKLFVFKKNKKDETATQRTVETSGSSEEIGTVSENTSQQ